MLLHSLLDGFSQEAMYRFNWIYLKADKHISYDCEMHIF